jgi:hypothetical protein
MTALTVLGIWLLDGIRQEQSEEGCTTMEERPGFLQVIVGGLAGGVLLPQPSGRATHNPPKDGNDDKRPSTCERVPVACPLAW